jgi:hypothetical protein
MKKSIMRALVRGIIHAEGNMTMPEYIQDVREEIREEEMENDERTASRNREQEQQAYKESA